MSEISNAIAHLPNWAKLLLASLLVGNLVQLAIIYSLSHCNWRQDYDDPSYRVPTDTSQTTSTRA